MGQLYPLIDRINKRTGIPKSKVKMVYSTYFETIRNVFKDGTHPGVVLTGLMSYQFRPYAVKNKYEKLEHYIDTANYDALEKRFKVNNIDDAKVILIELKRIYKLVHAYDEQNKQAKRRENNGWEK